MNTFTLNSFLAVLGYHTGVIVVDADTHEELLHTDDFNLPYRLTGDVASKDYIVVAVGTFAVENIIVFVRRAEQ